MNHVALRKSIAKKTPQMQSAANPEVVIVDRYAFQEWWKNLTRQARVVAPEMHLGTPSAWRHPSGTGGVLSNEHKRSGNTGYHEYTVPLYRVTIFGMETRSCDPKARRLDEHTREAVVREYRVQSHRGDWPTITYPTLEIAQAAAVLAAYNHKICAPFHVEVREVPTEWSPVEADTPEREEGASNDQA